MAAATTTSIRFEAVGEPDVLEYKTVPMPEPGSGELRLKVDAIGIGFGECLYRRGFYVHKTVAPGSLGNNAVGVVDAVGPDVTTVSVGQRICLIPLFPMNKHATYGKHVIVPEAVAAPYFDQLSVEENASLWMQVSTAYGGLVQRAAITAEDTVLVIPASGGVGMAAIETVAKVGGVAIGVTRSAAKADAIRAVGAAHVIVTEEEDLVTRVDEITRGAGVRVVWNALTGDTLFTDLVRLLRPGGEIVQYGGIGGAPLTLPLVETIAKGVRLRGFTLYEIGMGKAALDEVRAWVVAGISGGHYKPNVGKVFAFEEMVEAHRYLEAGSMAGSVVVKV